MNKMIQLTEQEILLLKGLLERVLKEPQTTGSQLSVAVDLLRKLEAK